MRGPLLSNQSPPGARRGRAPARNDYLGRGFMEAQLATRGVLIPARAVRSSGEDGRREGANGAPGFLGPRESNRAAAAAGGAL